MLLLFSSRNHNGAKVHIFKLYIFEFLFFNNFLRHFLSFQSSIDCTIQKKYLDKIERTNWTSNMFWSHCEFLNRRFVWVRALSYLRLTTFAENQIAETDERINQRRRTQEMSEDLKSEGASSNVRGLICPLPWLG